MEEPTHYVPPIILPCVAFTEEQHSKNDFISTVDNYFYPTQSTDVCGRQRRLYGGANTW